MILVTGGAGFIGSYVNFLLNQRGIDSLVLDNLSRSFCSKESKAFDHKRFVKGDLRDKEGLKRLFRDYPIRAVMHFAALTDVGESVREPALYFENNVQGSLNLIEAMLEAHIFKFIFSSTAAVYGVPRQDLITEVHPLEPINPYGAGKCQVEKALQTYSETTPLTYVNFRYFNAGGGDPTGRLKNTKTHHNNLIPLLLTAVREKREIAVFGDDWPTPDGTCIRDYIHIHDIAEAHILALTYEKSNTFNLGNGQGFSVKEVIHTAERVLQQKIPYHIAPRRPGDPARLVADSKKAQCELGWHPQYPELEKIILDAAKALT